MGALIDNSSYASTAYKPLDTSSIDNDNSSVKDTGEDTSKSNAVLVANAGVQARQLDNSTPGSARVALAKPSDLAGSPQNSRRTAEWAQQKGADQLSTSQHSTVRNLYHSLLKVAPSDETPVDDAGTYQLGGGNATAPVDQEVVPASDDAEQDNAAAADDGIGLSDIQMDGDAAGKIAADDAPADDAQADAAPAQAGRENTFGFGDDAGIDALVAAMQALQKMANAERALQSQSLVLAREVTGLQADKIRESGETAMNGAISGAVMRMTGAGAGGAMQFKAVGIRKNSIQNEKIPQASLERTHATEKLALSNGTTAAQTGPKTITSTAKNGTKQAHDVIGDDGTLKTKDKSTLSTESIARKHQIATHEIMHEANSAKAGGISAAGEIVQAGGVATGNTADGIAQQQRAVTDAQEKNLENDAATAQTLASTMEAAKQKSEEGKDKTRDALQSLINNTSNTNAGIASAAAA